MSKWSTYALSLLFLISSSYSETTGIPLSLTRWMLDLETTPLFSAMHCSAKRQRKYTQELDVHLPTRHDKNKANDATCPSSNSCRLQPDEEDPAIFNLSNLKNPEKSSYHGIRAVNENQFVLIFDAAKEHFVLHRLDSNFDMMTIIPSGDSQGINLKNQTIARQKKAVKGVNKTTNSNKEVSRRKVEKPKTAKKPIREPTPEEESDDGLTIEYPGGQMHDQPKIYSSPIPTYHREIRESCERDEVLPDDVFLDLNIENSRQSSPSRAPPAEMSDEDIEMALEAELEQELLKESAGQTIDDNESDESEEE